jgi:hypothetical protein
MIHTSTVVSFLRSVHTSSFAEVMPLHLDKDVLTINLDGEVITVSLADRDHLTQLETLAIRESLALDLEQNYASDAGHLIRIMKNLSDVFTFWRELREETVRQHAA